MEFKKIAFFVEGQTEKIFVFKFLSEYLGWLNLCNTQRDNYGRISFIEATNCTGNTTFHIRIYDVHGGNSSTPLSTLKENIEKLVYNENFSLFISLADLYNGKNKQDDFEQTRNDQQEFINRKLSKYSQKIKFILAVMETEAWFLADYNFPCKLDSLLTPDYINEKLGIDIRTNDVEKILCPSKTINNIYNLIGQEYKKKEGQAYRITENLIDYNTLYSDEIRNKVKSWGYFCKCVEEVFA